MMEARNYGKRGLITFLYLWATLFSWSQSGNSNLYSNGFVHINTGPYIFIINEKDTLSPNVVYLIGPELELFIPVAETDNRILSARKQTSASHSDLYEASHLEYRILRNNTVIKDWSAVNDLALEEKDTIWEVRVSNQKNELTELPAKADTSKLIIVEGQRLQGVPIEKKILYRSPMGINDSIQIDLKFNDRISRIKSTVIKRLPLRPFLSYTLSDKEIDQYLLKDKKLLARLDTLPNAKLPSTYLMQKWDSLPTLVNLKFPSSTKRIFLKFAPLLAGEDSTLKITFRNSSDSILRSGQSLNDLLLNDLESGNSYSLAVSNINQPENIVLYHIAIDPEWYQTAWFKWTTATVLLMLLLLYFYMVYHNRITKNNKEKARIEMELKAIRSQLNPHFVFNSLNSIQGLVNADEKEKANQYLSEFSKLMRETLGGNNKEYIPLETELSILDRYLKLEQLRFGFQYSITISEGLDAGSIEIPALLLQPLVENAVKHGVSALLEKGIINIVAERKSTDLIITLSDNGKGFSVKQSNNNGFGIRLTQERISLLNQMSKENIISISFSQNQEGMVVSLQFKDCC